MRRSVAQSATHCAALHLRASSLSCSLAITCERERKNRHIALRTVFAQKRNSALVPSYLRGTFLLSPALCAGPCLQFSPSLSQNTSISSSEKTHLPQGTDNPTDRLTTHARTLSLSNSLSFSSSFALAPHQEIRKHDICLVF